MNKNDTNLHTKLHILTPQTPPTNFTVEQMKKIRNTKCLFSLHGLFYKYPKSKDNFRKWEFLTREEPIPPKKQPLFIPMCLLSTPSKKPKEKKSDLNAKCK